MNKTIQAAALAGLCLAAASGAAHAGNLPGCANAMSGATCSVSVPNGAFNGPADDDAYHQPNWGGAWEPEPLTHSVGEHIAPWRYLDASGGQHQRAASERGFTIAFPRDGVEQAVPLPALPAVHHDIDYTVEARVNSKEGPASVELSIELQQGGEPVAASSHSVALPGPVSGSHSVTTYVTLPAGKSADTLSITLRSPTHKRGLTVEGVSVTRENGDE